MADGKTSFVLHTAHAAPVRKLPDEEAGRLFKGLYGYVETGVLPELSPLADMAFAFIRERLDADAAKYAQTCQRRAEAGKKGGRPRKQEEASESKKSNCFFEKQKNPDTDTDTDSDTELLRNISPPNPLTGGAAAPQGEKRKRFVPPAVDEVAAYCRERGNGIDPSSFVDFYQSKGWMVGKNKMKDWRASVRQWEQKRKEQEAPMQAQQPGRRELKQL